MAALIVTLSNNLILLIHLDMYKVLSGAPDYRLHESLILLSETSS